MIAKQTHEELIYAEQIFKMLDIKPLEEFYIESNNYVHMDKYRINSELEVEYFYDNKEWVIEDYILHQILNGTYKIIKIKGE